MVLSDFPNVADVLPSWFQSLTFVVVSKAVPNFAVVETGVEHAFFGVFQPWHEKRMIISKTGERAWANAMIHSKTDLHLQDDDVIRFNGTQYRVLEQFEYQLNGYYQYNLTEDYIGAGPAT